MIKENILRILLVVFLSLTVVGCSNGDEEENCSSEAYIQSGDLNSDEEKIFSEESVSEVTGDFSESKESNVSEGTDVTDSSEETSVDENYFRNVVANFFKASTENEELQLCKVLKALNIDEGMVINLSQESPDSYIYGVNIGFKGNIGYAEYYKYADKTKYTLKIVLFENGQRKEWIDGGKMSATDFDIGSILEGNFYSNLSYVETNEEVINNETYMVETYEIKGEYSKFYFLGGDLKMMYDPSQEDEKLFQIQIGSPDDFNNSLFESAWTI